MMLIEFALGYIDVLGDAVRTATRAVDTVLAGGNGPVQVPPVNPTVPDEGLQEKIGTLLGWAGWAVSIACAVGFLGVAGRMAMAWRNGNEAAIGQLGWVLLAAAIVGSASAIINGIM